MGTDLTTTAMKYESGEKVETTTKQGNDWNLKANQMEGGGRIK